MNAQVYNQISIIVESWSLCAGAPQLEVVDSAFGTGIGLQILAGLETFVDFLLAEGLELVGPAFLLLLHLGVVGDLWRGLAAFPDAFEHFLLAVSACPDLLQSRLVRPLFHCRPFATDRQHLLLPHQVVQLLRETLPLRLVEWYCLLLLRPGDCGTDVLLRFAELLVRLAEGEVLWFVVAFEHLAEGVVVRPEVRGYLFHHIPILDDDVDLCLQLAGLLLEGGHPLPHPLQLPFLGSPLRLAFPVLPQFLAQLPAAGLQLAVHLLQTVHLLFLVVRLLPVDVGAVAVQTHLAVPFLRHPSQTVHLLRVPFAGGSAVLEFELQLAYLFHQLRFPVDSLLGLGAVVVPGRPGRTLLEVFAVDDAHVLREHLREVVFSPALDDVEALGVVGAVVGPADCHCLGQLCLSPHLKFMDLVLQPFLGPPEIVVFLGLIQAIHFQSFHCLLCLLPESVHAVYFLLKLADIFRVFLDLRLVIAFLLFEHLLELSAFLLVPLVCPFVVLILGEGGRHLFLLLFQQFRLLLLVSEFPLHVVQLELQLLLLDGRLAKLLFLLLRYLMNSAGEVFLLPFQLLLGRQSVFAVLFLQFLFFVVEFLQFLLECFFPVGVGGHDAFEFVLVQFHLAAHQLLLLVQRDHLSLQLQLSFLQISDKLGQSTVLLQNPSITLVAFRQLRPRCTYLLSQSLRNCLHLSSVLPLQQRYHLLRLPLLLRYLCCQFSACGPGFEFTLLMQSVEGLAKREVFLFEIGESSLQRFYLCLLLLDHLQIVAEVVLECARVLFGRTPPLFQRTLHIITVRPPHKARLCLQNHDQLGMSSRYICPTPNLSYFVPIIPLFAS